MIEWLDSSISSSVHVRLLARECKNEKVTIRSARPTPRRQKSTTWYRNAADRVPDKTPLATVPRIQQVVSRKGKEYRIARHRMPLDPLVQWRPHIRRLAVSRRLRRSRRWQYRSQS